MSNQIWHKRTRSEAEVKAGCVYYDNGLYYTRDGIEWSVVYHTVLKNWHCFADGCRLICYSYPTKRAAKAYIEELIKRNDGYKKYQESTPEELLGNFKKEGTK